MVMDHHGAGPTSPGRLVAWTSLPAGVIAVVLFGSVIGGVGEGVEGKGVADCGSGSRFWCADPEDEFDHDARGRASRRSVSIRSASSSQSTCSQSSSCVVRIWRGVAAAGSRTPQVRERTSRHGDPHRRRRRTVAQPVPPPPDAGSPRHLGERPCGRGPSPSLGQGLPALPMPPVCRELSRTASLHSARPPPRPRALLREPLRHSHGRALNSIKADV